MPGIASYEGLYPPFRDQLLKFDDVLKTNKFPAFSFETLRSIETQLAYWQKGRSFNELTKTWIITDLKAVVTKAQPGLSFHNYGVAVDKVFDGDVAKPGIQWTWKMPEEKWKALGYYGEKCGLQWAGEWKHFQEYPHFENSYGVDVHIAFEAHLSAGMPAVWALFDKNRQKKIIVI